MTDGRKSENNNYSRQEEEDVRVVRKKAGVYKKELSARRKREERCRYCYMLDTVNLRKANQRIRELEEKLHDKCVALEWVKDK